MKFLEDLYNGNIVPGELFFNDHQEYKKTLKKLSECTDELEKMISDNAKEELEKLLDIYAELSYIIELERFKAGFRFGGKMVYSCFVD